MKKIRANVYIDGLNLYYGIEEFNYPHLQWLNLQRLSENFLQAGTVLEEVKYFTSEFIQNEEAMKHQNEEAINR